MNNKGELKYSKEHEWVKVENDRAHIGITDFAQKSLGDIVFVELPDIGSKISAGDAFGVVESVKAASDVYCPISGTVTKVNEELNDSPENINKDAYEAWIIEIEISNPSELGNLMDEKEYEDFCSKEG